MATSFAELGVPPRLVASLADRDITQPTPIQAATVPDALEGRDVCGKAPTGSGKTIAFGIPLVLGVGRANPRKPRGLVLVPTRELAAQVDRELQLLAKPKGPWVQAFYGGVGFDRQVSALRRGVDIAVATPGRLADLINQRWVDLSEVALVVVDEADRMADMGFLPEVRRLLDACPDDRQTLLFSATLDGEVDVLIRNYQHDPVRHEHTEPDTGGSLAAHHFWSCERGSRVDVTAEVVDRLGPTVVFTRTKHGADRLARQLGDRGVRAVAIHGDRSQNQRERALASFLRGEAQTLVATDVAARGIHVDGVAGVVHFDPPGDHKDYVHRSGRTARAGNTGVVVSLVPRELRAKVESMQRELGYPVGLDRVDVDALPMGAPAASTEAKRPAERSHDHTAPTAPSRPPSTPRSKPASTSKPKRTASDSPNRTAGPKAKPKRTTSDSPNRTAGPKAKPHPSAKRAASDSSNRTADDGSRPAKGTDPRRKPGSKGKPKGGPKGARKAAATGRAKAAPKSGPRSANAPRGRGAPKGRGRG